MIFSERKKEEEEETNYLDSFGTFCSHTEGGKDALIKLYFVSQFNVWHANHLSVVGTEAPDILYAPRVDRIKRTHPFSCLSNAICIGMKETMWFCARSATLFVCSRWFLRFKKCDAIERMLRYSCVAKYLRERVKYRWNLHFIWYCSHTPF